jgi:hypothetical protein
MYLVKHSIDSIGFSFSFQEKKDSVVELEFTRYGTACSCCKYDHQLPCKHCSFIAIKVFRSRTMLDSMEKYNGRFSVFLFTCNIYQLYNEAFPHACSSGIEWDDFAEEDLQSHDNEQIKISSDRCAVCFGSFVPDDSDCCITKDGQEIHEDCLRIINTL